MLKQTIGKLARSLDATRGRSRGHSATTVDRLLERSLEQSAEFVELHLAHASLFSSAEGIRAFCAGLFPSLPPGMFLEFGFYKGDSARIFCAGLHGKHLTCFDSFEGLRNTWSQVDISVGAFSEGGLAPDGWEQEPVDFVVGWVEDTLPKFLSESKDPISFVHLDLDVYEPTLFVLGLLRSRLQRGSLILFDELHGFPGFRNHELRALNEVLSPDEYRFIGFGPQQAALQILVSL